MRHKDGLGALPFKRQDEQTYILAHYMQVIAFIGIGSMVIMTLVNRLLQTTSQDFVVTGVFLILCLATLILLHYDKVTWAAYLLVSLGLVIIILYGQSSYEAFLLMTTGFASLVLGAMVLLPSRSWIIYLLLSLIYLIGSNIQFINQMPPGEYRDGSTILGIAQITSFLLGAAFVGMAYRMMMQHHERRKQTIVEMQQGRVLLEQRSAELEATNAELIRSKNHYHTLIETATEAIFLCVYPSWEILDTNSAGTRLLKCSREQLLNVTMLDFTQGASVRLGQEIDRDMFFSTLEAGKILEFEQIHVDAEGGEHLCQVRMLKLPDENRVRATVIDITRQRSAEFEAREATEKLQLISDNLSVLFAYYDSQLRLQYWNKPVSNLLRLQNVSPPISIYDLRNQYIIEMIAPYLSAALRGEASEPELTLTTKKGKRIAGKAKFVPHVVDGQVVGIFSVAMDVTAERDAQEALANTTQLLQLVTDTMPARLAYVSSDDKIQFLNKHYEAFGIDRESAIGKSPLEVIPVSMQRDRADAIRRIQSGQSFIKEQRIILKSGEERIEHVVKVPHVIDGRLQGHVVLISDVTQLRTAEEALQRAQKMESLGVLAGGIAHDFNNLLVAILGQSSIAAAKLPAVHPAKQHLDRAIQASERAATLTNQMLAYSGHGAFAIAPLNINHLIQENLDLFRVSVPQTTSFSTQLSPTLPLIEADAAQIQQVIMNLIINAGQAIEGRRGTIRVLTRSQALSEADIDRLQLSEGTLSPGCHVVVSVTDDGKGMNEKTRKCIFDPFFTTKETGSGLGLAAVLGIMQGHMGGIAVQSESDHGTTFSLYFPASQHVEINMINSAEINLQHNTSGQTVLVIDDDISVTNAIADILDLEDIAVVERNDPRKGIAYYRDHHDEIDVVMLDLMMPNMNGAEVFEALYKIDPEVCVLLSSGYSRQDVRRRFIVNGVADFIQKPYNFQQLIDRVQGLFKN